MPKMNVAALIEMCDRIEALGGDPNHPEIVARFLPVEPGFATTVDQTLDPFSDAYHDRQIALYREIAGRALAQETGELHDVDIAALVHAPNPLGLRDVAHVGEHVRVLSTMLALAALDGEPDILDMGAGHGLSAETYAFAGCRVTAVDIDPALSELSRRRAAARHLSIERRVLSYDDLSSLPDARYAAAFFFQSLHHCVRPWTLIARLRAKLVADGVIAFAGEPIQTDWWRHWGLRLDPESLFVARTRGWFECGWSHDFIRDCFARSGMTLAFFSGGIDGGEIGVAAHDADRLVAVRAKAARIGLREIRSPGGPDVPETALASTCGVRAAVPGGDGYRQAGLAGGALVYGPYITLPPGRYEATTIVSRDPGAAGRAVFEVVAARGAHRLASARHPRWRGHGPRLLVVRFAIARETPDIELRVRVSGACGWTTTIPALRRTGSTAP